MMTVSTDEPLVVAVVDAIHRGDVERLQRLLADNPGLASIRIGDERMSRTLLHVATDWPGHFPPGITGSGSHRRPVNSMARSYAHRRPQCIPAVTCPRSPS
jgi:hypothetical protein